ncbi:MAG: hypothetical protein J6T01_06150 [Kiritimatiellae bacterium]|nr:hypothetical protein [Kiritimatiellia bacterium]
MKIKPAMLLTVLAASGAAARPTLVINEDNDHYFKLAPERMTREALEGYVDEMCAGGRVTHVFFCTCGQRASFDSKAWEPIWAGLNDPGTDGKTTNNIWCANAKLLHDRGIDPYRVWIERCRRHGVSPWVSMRMNDVHYMPITNYFRNTTFCRSRPDLWRKPHSRGGDWLDYALDFGHAEVREYTFAMAAELIGRYEADGLELDFNRFPLYFAVGREREQTPVLTEFVRRIRAVAEARAQRLGRPYRLAARVPSTILLCTGAGMDPVEWARRGLVDWIIPCNNYMAMDFTLPIAEWKRELAAASPSVKVTPGTDMNIAFDRSVCIKADVPAYRAWAANMYGEGADGLYLFNTPYHDIENARSPETAKTIYSSDCLDPARVGGGHRRFVRSVRDWGECKPTPNGGPYTVTLPSRRPAAKRAELVLGFNAPVAAANAPQVTVGGTALKPPRAAKDVGPYGGSCCALVWNVPTGLLKARGNEIRCTGEPPAKVTWCEISLDGE